VAAEKRQQAFADAALRDECARFIGEFVQSRAARPNRQGAAGLAKHRGRLAGARRLRQRFTDAPRSAQNKSARREAGAF
jgi:hypothetical protein